MHIANHIAKGQVLSLHFGQLNVAASQTAVALPVGGVTGAAIGETVAFDGDLISLAYNLSAAGTAGVFTVSATINGTVVASSTLTVGTTTKGSIKIQRAKARVVAGDVVGVKITTNGSWDGTTADLAVSLGVIQELVGI